MIYESDRNMGLGSVKRPSAWITELPAQKKAYHAIQMNDVALLSDAISEGADLHNLIRPLLPEAAGGQRITLCEYLLSRGAQVNFPNSQKQTATYLAAQSGKKELLELLISQGADASKSDAWGTTPLMTATFHGHASCVEFLIACGASVNDRDAEGLSVLGHVRHGRSAMAWKRRRSIHELRGFFSDGVLSQDALEEALEEDFELLRSQEEQFDRIKRALVQSGAIDCQTTVPVLTFPKKEQHNERKSRVSS
jgi:hypothetical protein